MDPGALDADAMAKTAAKLNQVNRRIATEVMTSDAAALLEERAPQVEDNHRALTRVVTTVMGESRQTAPQSETMRLIQRLKGQAAQAEPEAAPRQAVKRLEQQREAKPKLSKSMEALQKLAEEEASNS